MTEKPHQFVYRGSVFSCTPLPCLGGTFGVRVRYLSGALASAEDLPEDAEPYRSEAEALRHGEQQAMRWVHDRTGEGQGQF
ncbi:hypothetical protein SAMN05216567_113107 [Variovorax sp. OK605]|jgi:hypothetical protein|uniref:hypothetical protein n=1 Tax=Variovorax sp. OK605 TaxID=1855317 RepID=UPI0008EA382F|nr:hypothetical protein [Variovorax sp. OK605]SFQ29400.1 hypothetical protein SAMN05216567_113107 [Variovorax sp. OK605]